MAFIHMLGPEKYLVHEVSQSRVVSFSVHSRSSILCFFIHVVSEVSGRLWHMGGVRWGEVG